MYYCTYLLIKTKLTKHMYNILKSAIHNQATDDLNYM